MSLGIEFILLCGFAVIMGAFVGTVIGNIIRYFKK